MAARTDSDEDQARSQANMPDQAHVDPGQLHAGTVPDPSVDSMGGLLTRGDVQRLLEQCCARQAPPEGSASGPEVADHVTDQAALAVFRMPLATMEAEIDRLRAALKAAGGQARFWEDKAMQLQGDVQQLRDDNHSLLERQERLRTAARLGIGTLEMVGSNLSVANVLRNGLRY